jgi:hypothetical protein
VIMADNEDRPEDDKPADEAQEKPAKKKKAKESEEDKKSALGIEDRTTEWCEDEDVIEQVEKIYEAVIAGYDDKSDQNLTIDRCWDVYNCVLNDNQGYNGYSQVYVPLVHDAIEARVTRFVNQLFPPTGRYSEVTSTDGTTPYEIMSLLDNYVELASLRDDIAPALVRAGDVTGQYSIEVDWNKVERNTLRRVQRSELQAEDGTEVDDGDEGFTDIEMEKVIDENPAVQVIDTRDLLVLPASVDDIKDASVIAKAMRLTKDGVQKYIDDGVFDEDAAAHLLDNFSSTNRDNQPDTQKKSINAAGVRTDSKGSKTALIYKVWAKIELEEGKKRWCLMYFAGEDNILSCKRNPYWNDKIDIITKPAVKVSGSIWGKGRVEGGVEKLQYAANDAVNMGFDSAQYSLAPIVMTDPEKNPRSGSIVMAMAAVWLTDPNSTEVIQFPQLWKEAFAVVMDCKAQIQQSIGTNPAMMPQGNAGKKPSQSQVSQEQQVALEATADVIGILDVGIFSPMLEMFFDLDYQYRDKAMLVKRYGPLGHYAVMEEVPPLQTGRKYTFKWYGAEANRSIQQIQQMISSMNVFKGIPPEQLNGRKFDAGPLLDHVALTVFGPRLAPHVLIDQMHMLSMDPEEENKMLASNFFVEVNPMDPDMEHIKSHHADMLVKGDSAGMYRGHIIKHMMQAQAKAQAAMGQGKGAQGTPGAGGQPGSPGSPRPGAIAGPQKPAQAPPGAIHQDQINDASRVPR